MKKRIITTLLCVTAMNSSTISFTNTSYATSTVQFDISIKQREASSNTIPSSVRYTTPPTELLSIKAPVVNLKELLAEVIGNPDARIAIDKQEWQVRWGNYPNTNKKIEIEYYNPEGGGKRAIDWSRLNDDPVRSESTYHEFNAKTNRWYICVDYIAKGRCLTANPVPDINYLPNEVRAIIACATLGESAWQIIVEIAENEATISRNRREEDHEIRNARNNSIAEQLRTLANEGRFDAQLLFFQQIETFAEYELPFTLIYSRPEAEQRAAEQRAAEQQAAEQRAAEQRAAEQRAAQQAAEQQAAQRAAEQRAAEQRAAQQAAEQRAAQQAAEQRAAEQRAAEQRVTDVLAADALAVNLQRAINLQRAEIRNSCNYPHILHKKPKNKLELAAQRAADRQQLADLEGAAGLQQARQAERRGAVAQKKMDVSHLLKLNE